MKAQLLLLILAAFVACAYGVVPQCQKYDLTMYGGANGTSSPIVFLPIRRALSSLVLISLPSVILFIIPLI